MTIIENQFYLMNKDIKILKFEMEQVEYGDIKLQETEKYSEVLPINYDSITSWLVGRRAPIHRAHMEELLKKCGCNTLDGFIRVSYALTLNDTFWVKGADSHEQWNDVSLYQNEFNEVISRIAFEGGIYGEHFASISPEYGTNAMSFT